ncbi:SnoaL-like protein [Mucilaginibacter yixingensis]|uniref:SnoaL-like protein n=1 Tax=Mucilaginibacter yixingensis TaxID=1295612 RepID=A0A2T5J648_9SPHI|nr:nuclear transport factor 2 family protein [Mucilaginibacter yixingensis]PTQ94017.1 SnoaL-like protein [Mucilaginibacter yixingensis]
MIAAQHATQFAHHWIEAWNRHDLDAIMEHYVDDVQFCSPMIIQLQVNELGKIDGTDELRRYFETALKAYPHLRFTLLNVLAGVNTIVVHYVSVNDKQAAEVFELNANGKVKTVLCNYA